MLFHSLVLLDLLTSKRIGEEKKNVEGLVGRGGVGFGREVRRITSFRISAKGWQDNEREERSSYNNNTKHFIGFRNTI